MLNGKQLLSAIGIKLGVLPNQMAHDTLEYERTEECTSAEEYHRIFSDYLNYIDNTPDLDGHDEWKIYDAGYMEGFKDAVEFLMAKLDDPTLDSRSIGGYHEVPGTPTQEYYNYHNSFPTASDTSITERTGALEDEEDNTVLTRGPDGSITIRTDLCSEVYDIEESAVSMATSSEDY